MRPIAYNHIYHLSNELTNPARATWLMRDYMRKAIMLSNHTMTKDTIFKFMKARIGFKDVEKIAENIIYKQKSGDYSRDAKYLVVKDLMKHKMNDSIKCIKTAKKDLKKSNQNLSKVVRRGTIVRNEYMEVVDRELKSLWKEGKAKNEQKLEWISKKVEPKTDEHVDTFKGVIVDDKLLEDFEDKLTKAKQSKPSALGGIEVNKDEEKVLNIPPNHSTYPRIDMEEIKTEIEKCVIKTKWGNMKEQRKNEDH